MNTEAKTCPIPQLTRKRRAYFSTLIYSFDLPEPQGLIERLLKLTYAERKRDQAGVEKSNFRKLGGWHSQTNLHKSPDYHELVDIIEEGAGSISSELEYHESYSLRIGTMWSIINPPGSANVAHVHPGCIWSGVLYLQTPQDSGKIAFTDPRTANIMQKPKYAPDQRRPRECWTKVNFTPVAGRMLIFPSWLYHSVAPNLSEEEGANADRVIISFNISQKKN